MIEDEQLNAEVIRVVNEIVREEIFYVGFKYERCDVSECK